MVMPPPARSPQAGDDHVLAVLLRRCQREVKEVWKELSFVYQDGVGIGVVLVAEKRAELVA